MGYSGMSFHMHTPHLFNSQRVYYTQNTTSVFGFVSLRLHCLWGTHQHDHGAHFDRHSDEYDEYYDGKSGALGRVWALLGPALFHHVHSGV